MENNKLSMGKIESQFADIIWSCEPITSNKLSKICEEKFNWKKTTSFTVLKRLCNKGLFKNEKGMVTSLIKREDFYAKQSKQFIKETFNGSLPAFLTAFTSKNKLSQKEVEQLRKIISEYEEE